MILLSSKSVDSEQAFLIEPAASGQVKITTFSTAQIQRL